VVEGELANIDGKFDAITLWDVIEHLKDPVQTVHDVNKRLAKDGYLFFSTGDASSLLPRISLRHWSLMSPPWHLYYFNRRNIRKLLESHGFRVVEIKHLGKTMELRWILFKIADTLDSKVMRSIYEWARKRSVGRIRLRVNTFDIMTVVAQKVR
jgi:SAM-dependent methyltransferase